MATKFEIGEQTGQKADPQQVSVDMRNARDTSNKRKVFKTRMGFKNADKGLFFTSHGRQKKTQTTSELINPKELGTKEVFADERPQAQTALLDEI